MSDMKQTITLYVVHSPTNGFYCVDQDWHGEYNFTDKLSRAQKWVNIPVDVLANLADRTSIFTDASVREVQVTMTLSKEESDHLGPIRREFAELDVDAERDIEAMSKHRWIRWKKLKKVLEAANE